MTLYSIDSPSCVHKHAAISHRPTCSLYCLHSVVVNHQLLLLFIIIYSGFVDAVVLDNTLLC